MSDVLAEVRRAFGTVARPERFTDCRAESEWAEHEETLRAFTPDTISLDQVGHAGWDPVCFLSTQGFQYYMPGLARLSLAGGYLGEFLFQLNDDRLASFSPEQRIATRTLLEFIRDQRSDEVRAWMAESELSERLQALTS